MQGVDEDELGLLEVEEVVHGVEEGEEELGLLEVVDVVHGVEEDDEELVVHGVEEGEEELGLLDVEDVVQGVDDEDGLDVGGQDLDGQEKGGGGEYPFHGCEVLVSQGVLDGFSPARAGEASALSAIAKVETFMISEAQSK